MPARSKINFNNRSLDDVIVRLGEQLQRGELDRPIGEADKVFSLLHTDYRDSRGLRLYLAPPNLESPNRPVRLATHFVQTTGRVAIANIGCGTGNELVTWGREVAKAAKCKLGKVGMTGVSLHDYRLDSMNPDTVRAFLSNYQFLKYEVANAEHMPAVPSKSQDVVMAYHALIYAHHADEWLREMVRISHPGSTILFDSLLEQLFDEDLIGYLDELSGSGYPMQRNVVGLPVFVDNDPATPLGYHKEVLYRIDIPG